MAEAVSVDPFCLRRIELEWDNANRRRLVIVAALRWQAHHDR
jgi:hypothetical protein